MIARYARYVPVHPYAILPTAQTGNIFGDAWDATKRAANAVGDAVGDAAEAVGGAVEDAVDAVGDAAEAVGGAVEDAVDAVGDAAEWVGDQVETGAGYVADAAKWVGNGVGDAAKWVYEHDPIMQLTAKIASGENVWQALKETGAIVTEDVKIFGPYVAYVPGIGTAAAMAIAAGVALANGKRLDEIALEAARGVIPPGPALVAFDAANALVHGKGISDSVLAGVKGSLPEQLGGAVDAALAVVKGGNVTEAALAAARGALPDEAHGVFDAAVAVAKGENVAEAAMSAVRDAMAQALPAEAVAAFDTGVAIAKGKRVQDAIADGLQGYLPPGYQEAFDAAREIANGKNVLDVAIKEAKGHLPPEAQVAAEAAIEIVKGGKVQDALLTAARVAIPGDYVKYFDMATGLLHMDQSKAIAEVMAQIPPGTPVAEAYAMAKKIQKEGVVGAARAAGASALQATGAGTLLKGLDKNKFASLTAGLKASVHGAPEPRAAVGASAYVNVALDVAIDALRKQLPSKPLAVAAFDAAVNIVKGKSIENIAAEVAKQYIPKEYKDKVEQAAKVVDSAIHGGNLGDIAIETLKNQVPPEMAGYVDVGLGIVKGEKAQDAAIAAAKAALPKEMMPAFNAAISIVDGGYRDALKAAIASQMPTGLSLQDAFSKAQELGQGLFPADVIANARASLGSDALKGVFDKIALLAKGKAIQEIATDIVKGFIPPEAKDIYMKAATIADHANPSEVALGVVRAQLPASAQHTVDGAAAIFKGKAPEEIANDEMVKGAIERSLFWKRQAGEIPPAPVRLVGGRKIIKFAGRNRLPAEALSKTSFAKVQGSAAVGGIASMTNQILANNPVQKLEQSIKDDYRVFDQAINDIAMRRAALGDATPYTGPALDPAFQKLVDQKTAEYKPKSSETSAAPLLLFGGAVAAAAGGYVLWKKGYLRRK